MYIQFGSPKKLSSLPISVDNWAQIKRTYQIAVVDDQPFPKTEALRNHQFSVVELGDIKAVDQIAQYPIVVCDIRGVGKSLSSTLEGAHLASEIRKAYPDKYLVSYSGAEFDITYNESLRSVDASIAKDAPTDQWVNVLENALKKVSDPKERWIRLRKNLLDKGVELYDVFVLEQRFIKAIENKDATQLTSGALPKEAKQVVIAFARFALVQIIKSLAA